MFAIASPWMADSEIELSRKVRDDELVFPESWGNKIDPSLKNLLVRLLTKDYGERPTLDETKDHEWVTDEGADPLRQYPEYLVVDDQDEDKLGDFVGELSPSFPMTSNCFCGSRCRRRMPKKQYRSQSSGNVRNQIC